MAQKKVIIIDDSKYVVDKLQQFFSEYLKFTVAGTANDGVFALDLYKRHKPDLVTLDIMMPNMDGITTLKELLKYDPGVNVLMVSAVRGDSMLRCMVLGAKGYIEKPVKLHDEAFVNDLTDTVKDILGQF